MPTYYYEDSNFATKHLVRNKDYENINKYILNPKEFYGLYDGDWDGHGDERDGDWDDERDYKGEDIDPVYQIATSAVSQNNIDVLNHIKNKINFDHLRDDNTYDLFVMATEYQYFHLIDILWNIALENGQGDIARDQLCYAARRLMAYTEPELKEEDVLKYLPLYHKEGVKFDDVYHYSIFWKMSLIRKWLEENITDQDLIENNKCYHEFYKQNDIIF